MPVSPPLFSMQSNRRAEGEGKGPGLCPGALHCVAPLPAPGSLRVSCSAGSCSVLPFFAAQPVGEGDLASQPAFRDKPLGDGEGRSRLFPWGNMPAQNPTLSQGGISAVPRTEPCTCVPSPCAIPSLLLQLSAAHAEQQR